MISGRQICAARALLSWRGEDLARIAGVGLTTIKRFEMERDVNKVPTSQVSVLSAIKSALERGGVDFINLPGKNPGVMYVGPREKVWVESDQGQEMTKVRK